MKPPTLTLWGQPWCQNQARIQQKRQLSADVSDEHRDTNQHNTKHTESSSTWKNIIHHDQVIFIPTTLRITQHIQTFLGTVFSLTVKTLRSTPQWPILISRVASCLDEGCPRHAYGTLSLNSTLWLTIWGLNYFSQINSQTRHSSNCKIIYPFMIK